MINDYFFIKCVFRWSENSVKFENLMGIGFRSAKFCEILSHSVRYGMYGLHCTRHQQESYLDSILRTVLTDEVEILV